MATKSLVIHPVFIVKVNNTMRCALLNTGAGSSYASGALLDRIKLKPIVEETKNIDIMMSSTTRKLEISDGDIVWEIQNKFSSVQSRENTLLSLPNPKYKAIIDQYKYLARITMNDNDTKPELPIHILLEASDYARLKYQKC